MIGTRTRTLGAVVGALLVVGLTACGSSGGSSARDSSTSSEVPGQSPRPTTPLPSVQVLHETGTGDATTKTFDVHERWGVAWSYDCSQKPDAAESFTISVLEYGQPSSDGSRTATQVSDSGVEHFTSGPGTRSLKIETACSWTVTVGNES